MIVSPSEIQRIFNELATVVNENREVWQYAQGASKVTFLVLDEDLFRKLASYQPPADPVQNPSEPPTPPEPIPPPDQNPADTMLFPIEPQEQEPVMRVPEEGIVI